MNHACVLLRDSVVALDESQSHVAQVVQAAEDEERALTSFKVWVVFEQPQVHVRTTRGRTLLLDVLQLVVALHEVLVGDTAEDAQQ